MYLLVPIVKYNQITEQEEDVVLSLIDLTPAGISSIDEIKEDKEDEIKAGVLINYKSGDIKELRFPFLDLLDVLNSNQLVNFSMVEHCVKHSEELYKRVEAGKAIIAKDAMKASAPYYKNTD